MTFVLNEGLTTLTLDTTIIDDLIANPGGSLSLVVYPTCESPGITIPILVGGLSAGTYVLNSSALGMSVFAEGPYRFVFKFINGSTVLIEDKIFLIYKDILCKIIKYYADKNITCLEESPCQDNVILWPYIHFDLLKQVHLCSIVCHAEACSMWKMLSDLVGKTVDCGCH